MFKLRPRKYQPVTALGTTNTTVPSRMNATLPSFPVTSPPLWREPTTISTPACRRDTANKDRNGMSNAASSSEAVAGDIGVDFKRGSDASLVEEEAGARPAEGSMIAQPQGPVRGHLEF